MLAGLGIFLILVAIIWLIALMVVCKNNYNYPKIRREKLNNLAIIIPARDEAKVIEELLVSITEQTFKVDMKNVYVIVENKDDPAVQIAQKYGVSLFLRKNLELQSKGYALQELIEFLCQKNIYYDAYFIFDADNVLDKDFILRMEDTYKQGYDIGMGYRNFKNGYDSLVAAASGISFHLVNSLGNETKSKESRNITLAGTGLFISGELIKKWQTFPFHSLTEDYELTLYSIENNLTSNYNRNAIFYDEQPVLYEESVKQRVRWIRGYLDNQKIYLPRLLKLTKNNQNYASVLTEITGVWPYVLLVVGILFYSLDKILSILTFNHIFNALGKLIFIWGLTYLVLVIMVFYIMIKDKDRITLNRDVWLRAGFFTPIFLLSYVPCALQALLKRKIKWEKIEHKGSSE